MKTKTKAEFLSYIKQLRKNYLNWTGKDDGYRSGPIKEPTQYRINFQDDDRELGLCLILEMLDERKGELVQFTVESSIIVYLPGEGEDWICKTLKRLGYDAKVEYNDDLEVSIFTARTKEESEK